MYQGYLVDLDGTLYKGSLPIPHAKEFIDKLNDKGIPYTLVTNNATRRVEEIKDNLSNNFDIQVDLDNIYTSPMALSDYLAKNYHHPTLYVIGEKSLKSYFKDLGYKLTDALGADVVVQGLQQDVTYDELSYAVLNLNDGADFLVTNADRLIPSVEGMKPSSGAITAFLQYASQVQPLIFGKPNAPILEGAIARLGLDKDAVAMIGDNYETDIMLGINGGIDTILVLSGVTQEKDLPSLPTQPSHIIHNLSEWKL